jgi:cation transport ATPase
MDNEAREREWERKLAAERARKREQWRAIAMSVVWMLPALGVMLLPILFLDPSGTLWWRTVPFWLVLVVVQLVRRARQDQRRDWSAGRE